MAEETWSRTPCLGLGRRPSGHGLRIGLSRFGSVSTNLWSRIWEVRLRFHYVLSTIVCYQLTVLHEQYQEFNYLRSHNTRATRASENSLFAGVVKLRPKHNIYHLDYSIIFVVTCSVTRLFSDFRILKQRYYTYTSIFAKHFLLPVTSVNYTLYIFLTVQFAHPHVAIGQMMFSSRVISIICQGCTIHSLLCLADNGLFTRTWLRYVRVFAVAIPSVCLSVVCRLSRWCTLLGRLKLSATFLHRCVRWPSSDLRAKFYGDSPSGTPPSGALNARGLSKYSDFRPIEGYIS